MVFSSTAISNAPRKKYSSLQKTIDKWCITSDQKFKKIVRSHVFFHLFFFGLIGIEIAVFICLITHLLHTALLAFSIAGILLTACIYTTLTLYLQTKKSEQLITLKNQFIKKSQLIFSSSSPTDIRLFIANAAHKFASYIHQTHVKIHTNNIHTHSLNRMIKRFTQYCYKTDAYHMKELLHLAAIHQHIQLIKLSPTSVEAHASLANSYMALSHVYQNTNKEQFKLLAKKAIQEFQIINHYSPNDPWVHAQLASTYHSLNMYQNEIQEYQLLLKLCPNDKHVMFRLGVLHFQEGENAEGLHIYEQLKIINVSRAHELIEYYDTRINTLV